MKSKRKSVQRDDKEQSKLFIEKAREIEADEKRSAADKLLGRWRRRSQSANETKVKCLSGWQMRRESR
jgi:hypothetical protein